MYFRNRQHAGQLLAKALSVYEGLKDTVLLALPRGGVPIAFEIFQQLHLPLNVLLVQKLGVPGQKELAFGAIAEEGIIYLNQGIVSEVGIDQATIDTVIHRETLELNRRRKIYRQDLPVPQLQGKTIIIVDDGLATGATMHAAVNALKQVSVERIVVAVPVGARQTCLELKDITNEVICLSNPDRFFAIGSWYEDFSQVSDQEVKRLLRQSIL